MKKIKIWLSAIRPRTLPAAAAPVLIGTAMALDVKMLNIFIFLVTLITALLIQIGTNLANDYFDYIKGADTEERTGPQRVTQSGLITKKEARFSIIITFFLAILCGSFLTFIGGIPIFIVGILAVFFGIIYTAGPFPLGYKGLADIFVFVFFGPIAAAGTFYLQTLTINLPVILAGLATGFLSVSILTANNLRDINTDRKSGKKTLVVRFGYRFGVFEYFFCMIAAFIIPPVVTFITRDHYFSLLSVLCIIPSIFLMKKVSSKPGSRELIKVLTDTGKVLMVYSFLFSFGWIL